MVVLCFVVDISLLSFTALKAVKNCLLQFGNLHALRSSRQSDTSAIGLCYISICESSGAYQLNVVQKPIGAFDLRQFHHAVRTMPSSMLGRIKLDKCEYRNQVSSISTLLKGEEGLLSWATEDAVKKVVIISSRFLESVTTFKQSLLEAADHFVTLEFIEIEQPEIGGRIVTHDEVQEPEVEVTHAFAIQVSEFENCTLHRVPFDPWTLMRLMKRWHQDLLFGSDGTIEAVLLFPVVLSAATNKVFCSFQPGVMQLADVFKPCKICRCHGQPIEIPKKAMPNSKEAPAAVCGVTGQKLGIHPLADNGIMVGSGIVLSMPSFKTPVIPATSNFGQGNPVAFDVIKCVSLETLDEVFAALLQDLYSRDCGLLCTSTMNIETGEETAFLCFYILLPAPKGSFSAKRLAGAEEIMVAPESASAQDNLEVSNQLKCAVSLGLSKLGTETYNPLKHLRGCHSKLTCMVKESLQPPGVEHARVAPRPPQLQDEEILISDFGFDSEGRSIDKAAVPAGQTLRSPAYSVTPATPTPELPTKFPTTVIGKRACNSRLNPQKSNPLRQNPARMSKGRAKAHQGLCYPNLHKPSMTSQQDPYTFSPEPSQGTKIPLLPSARFPNFKTARQHLLDSGK